MTVDGDNYTEFLQISRVRIVPVIKIFITCCAIRDIFENILNALLDCRSQLKKLEIAGDVDFLSLDPELLSQSLVRLEEFRRVQSDLRTTVNHCQLPSLLVFLKR